MIDAYNGFAMAVNNGLRIGNDLCLLDKADISLSSPRKVDAYTLVIVDRGSACVALQGKNYEIVAPNMLFLLPGQTCCIERVSDDVAFRAVIMSERFGNRLFASPQAGVLYSLIDANPVVDIGNDVVALKSYYRLLVNAASSPAAEYMLDTARHLLLSMLFFYARKAQSGETPCGKRDMLFARFCDDLRNYHRLNRSLPFYAGRLGVSTKLLTEVVKERKGMTAADYIDDFVLTECKALLSSTDMPVQSISRSMHFLSPSVFGKFFKRLTGVSPTEYREKTR